MYPKLLAAYRETLETSEAPKAPSDVPAHWQDRLQNIFPSRKKRAESDHEMGRVDQG